mmetsp:Transcript_18352/g.42049  ORF Transcript_18352/g.42049 Transcript_18352/m.42049 type:complete len:252 (-) Transcript_18352:229-984(-)
MQCGGERGDGVVVGASLVPGEDGRVDGPLQIVRDLFALLVEAAHALAVEDHRAARPSQRLVGGRGDDVRVVEWGRHDARRDEARDVRHVREQVRAHLVADLPHARVVDVPRVGRGARDDQLWPEERGVLLELVVIDVAGGLVQPIRHRLEVHGDHRDLLGVRLEAVREVPPVWKVEAHQAVVWLEDGREDTEVRRRARERLHVHPPLVRVRAEGFERAGSAQVLCHVDELVAAVVSRRRVPLRILIRHHRA